MQGGNRCSRSSATATAPGFGSPSWRTRPRSDARSRWSCAIRIHRLMPLCWNAISHSHIPPGEGPPGRHRRRWPAGGCGNGTLRRRPELHQNDFQSEPAAEKGLALSARWIFSIRRIDNFVVTAGRSSCCSWASVYRIPTSEREITAQDLAYDITVSGPIEKDSTTARCRSHAPRERVGEHRCTAPIPAPALSFLRR